MAPAAGSFPLRVPSPTPASVSRKKDPHIGAREGRAGVQYIRTRDPKTGRVAAWKWQHDGIDSERVKKAYGLLISTNLSFEEIAARIGGGWTGKGIKESLQNPIWIGLRRYQYVASGEEYTPIGRDGKPRKKRKRLIKLAEPVLVPIDTEH